MSTSALRRSACSLLVIALAALVPRGQLRAEPMVRSAVPAPLQPWIEWSLVGHEQELCPLLYGDEDERQCSWTASLQLTLQSSGGHFVQQSHMELAGWAALPGDESHWPQGVTVDRAPAMVLEHDGTPAVRLGPGTHVIEGAFLWDAPPDSMPIPEETALVALTLNGKPLPFPSRDDRGHLWLQKGDDTADERAEDRLDLVVHRRIDDGVPLVMTTHLELDVAGKRREVVLGPVVPEGFQLTAVTGPLPARVEPGALVRIQLRPGHFRIVLTARGMTSPKTLVAPRAEAPWPEEEVWCFAANPRVRLVTIEQAVAIDPQQTTIPSDWRALPTYRMRRGERWQLAEKRRGGGDSGDNQLALARTLWLDFDGRGYTVRDQLSGQLRRGHRLEVEPTMELGRIELDGRAKLITRLAPTGWAGVEVRQPQLRATADLRYQGRRGRLPAVGWNSDLQSLTAELRLPPGWRLFHAVGVDSAPGSWLNGWDLFDLFFLVVFAFAAAKLWGNRAGAIALVAMGLTLTETDAPTTWWLPLLVVEALRRVLPAGRLLRLANLARLGVVIGLAIQVLPFAVHQLRVALYPSLEHAETVLGGGGYDGNSIEPYARLAEATGGSMNIMGQMSPSAGGKKMALGPSAPPPSEAMSDRRDMPAAEAEIADALKRMPSKAIGLRKGGGYGASQLAQRNMMEHDPSAVVQTGPGVPSWQWHQVALRWSGPVAREQQLSLWLLPPWLNLGLALLRVAALALLLAIALGHPRNGQPFGRRGERPGTPRAPSASPLLMLAFAVGAALLVSEGTARADWPTAELLETLKGRLLDKPSCAPHCASSSRLWLEATPSALRLRWEVSAATATAVPLPASPKHWLPSHVLVDGKPAAALFRGDGDQLWLRLDPGRHEVLLEGPLPTRELVQLPLPLKPHRVEAKLQGWTLDGIHEDGLADDNLQLTRAAAADTGDTPTLQPTTLPPFVQVERTLHFGLSWEVDTKVVRLTPTGAAIVFESPLLPGESVTTADVRVASGRVQVNMGPNDAETSWRSVLQTQSTLRLTAPSSAMVLEVWRIDAGDLWHVEPTGLPPIFDSGTNGPGDGDAALPQYRPWPGETLQLALRRPTSAGGQTLTVDRSVMTVRPGHRVTDVELDLELRSSRGGQHPLTLPSGAELQSVQLDGRVQPLRPEGGVLMLPLRPGPQRYVLAWRQPGGIGSRLRAPHVRLGIAVVNAELRIELPDDRWPLLLGGDGVGPAILFWGMLVVLALAAVGLASIEWVPLRAAHWFLLGLGLTQVDLRAALLVVGWLLAVGWRRDHLQDRPAWQFNLAQLTLAVWTLMTCTILLDAVRHGLLLEPDMQIAGNGSNGSTLRWFRDRAGDELPHGWVLSVPRTVYRLLMLGWALWLAARVIGWARWAWSCASQGGLYRPRRQSSAPSGTTPGATTPGATAAPAGKPPAP